MTLSELQEKLRRMSLSVGPVTITPMEATEWESCVAQAVDHVREIDAYNSGLIDEIEDIRSEYETYRDRNP